ncbi:substrate-binding domain-containing protein [Amycolatopsis jiangsuensis]|uniref:4,5-dihydroxyphthalate decarboxylase n=1 Tax=Amycolatopsis jiangsuensis TaxID=1181879 RepID=A0A840J7A6_9PSEU|nr:hypothetical protein [Amycolatopsis jiangsuensis]MBB4689278.1 4,5-dihydroxyphthalate decarboxylase [Amycolatopsis jiangsuensis]
MRRLTAALRRSPQTEPLLGGTVSLDGCTLDLQDVSPIHEAFAPMVRDLRYDVSELALATLLQAVEAGVQIAALPVVLLGNFPHRALYVWGEENRIAPAELAGRRVGVRAYSQTTGLWARGILGDTYGVPSDEVTWVTTEGSHVDTAKDPATVERTSGTLVDALRAGDLTSVVLGAPFAAGIDELIPLLPDWEEQQERFYDQRGWVPANHLVVVRRELLRSEPDLIRGLYRGLAASIDAGLRAEPAGTVRARAVRYGISPGLLDMLGTAIRYAREQEVIHREIDAADLFADFEKYVGEA